MPPIESVFLLSSLIAWTFCVDLMHKLWKAAQKKWLTSPPLGTHNNNAFLDSAALLPYISSIGQSSLPLEYREHSFIRSSMTFILQNSILDARWTLWAIICSDLFISLCKTNKLVFKFFLKLLLFNLVGFIVLKRIRVFHFILVNFILFPPEYFSHLPLFWILQWHLRILDPLWYVICKCSSLHVISSFSP